MLYSERLRELAATRPRYMPEICNKLITKARASELGMAVPTLHGVFEQADLLDLDELPAHVVLKRHMDQSGVLLLRDGVDQRGVKWTTAMLRDWAAPQMAKRTSSGAPVKIFAEEYLLPPEGHAPNDHRFFVIGNIARFVLVTFDRFTKRKHLVYTAGWKRTPYWSRRNWWPRAHPGIERPACLAEMTSFAEEFSHTWPAETMVIDMFVHEGRPVFGEAGVFHGAGHPLHPEWDALMGKMWPARDSRFPEKMTP